MVKLSEKHIENLFEIHYILKTKPGNDDKDISIRTPIYARFNKPMEPMTINLDTFSMIDSKINDFLNGSISFTENNTKVIFKTAKPLEPSITYTATIESEATDVEGIYG